MSTVTHHGHQVLLGGKDEDNQILLQVFALKSAHPHVLVIRWDNKVFIIDQARFNEARVHLVKKVSLGQIIDAIRQENSVQLFSQQEPMDVRYRIEQVIVRLNSCHTLPQEGV